MLAVPAHEQVMWTALESADATCVKAMDSFSTFDWSSLSQCGLTPLQTVVMAIARTSTAEHKEVPQSKLDLISWMANRGADPLAVTARTCKVSFKYAYHTLEYYKVKVDLASHSTISFAVALKCAMIEYDRKEGYTFFEFPIKRIASVIDALAKCQVCKQKVSVDSGVLKVWEALRTDELTHDVVFCCSDGEISAHKSVLRAASPVLRAALDSGMLEGQQKRIEVRDSPAAGVSLFIDLLYSGTSFTAGPHSDALISALELAHRWQVDHVTAMLEVSLVILLSCPKVPSFVSIAQVAATLDLSALKTACMQCAATNETVKVLLKRGGLPSAVDAMLKKRQGGPSDEVGSASKRRRVF